MRHPFERARCWLAAGICLAGLSVPAAAQTASPEGTKVDASAGGLTVSSGFNSLTIGARAHFRWIVDKREAIDADRTGSGVGREDDVFSQFDVPRLRVTLSGGVHRPWFRYLFQFDFSRTSGEEASKIKDAILEIRPVDRPFRLMTGQFKAPFGLQQITSSGRQQFVERAITDSKFAPGRDMGVMWSGSAAGRKFGYDLGVFNGAGESNRQTRQSPLWAARVYYHPLSPYSPSEGSSDAGDAPALHVGLAVRTGAQIRGRTTAGVVQDADTQTAVGLEFVYKTARVFSTAEYFRMRDERENPSPLSDVRSAGYHAQLTYMVLPRTTEVGLRYARIEGDTSADDAAVGELRGVYNHYFRAHNLKFQADIGRLSYGAGVGLLPARARSGLPSLGNRLVTGEDLSDIELRLQLQVTF